MFSTGPEYSSTTSRTASSLYKLKHPGQHIIDPIMFCELFIIQKSIKQYHQLLHSQKQSFMVFLCSILLFVTLWFSASIIIVSSLRCVARRIGTSTISVCLFLCLCGCFIMSFAHSILLQFLLLYEKIIFAFTLNCVCLPCLALSLGFVLRISCIVMIRFRLYIDCSLPLA